MKNDEFKRIQELDSDDEIFEEYTIDSKRSSSPTKTSSSGPSKYSKRYIAKVVVCILAASL